MTKLNVTVTLIDTDQSFQNETTTYWFKLDGMDHGTEIEFDNEVIGAIDNNGDITFVLEEGDPIGSGDWQGIAVGNCIPADSVKLHEMYGGK